MTAISFIDERNKLLIKDLVSNHFGLTQESNERFSRLMDNPDIDETYAQYLGNDLRVRFPIDKMSLENYDRSWQLFKIYFPTYFTEFQVSYRDYFRGRVMVGKNELRLFKHIAMYYLETYRGRSAFHCDIGFGNEFSTRSTTNLFEEKINEVIRRRLPSKNNFEVVLSLNFADWFLCSTGEDWTSCLNLESQYGPSYWSGLPGYIVDKNRAMIYITTGEKKEYLGIITDKVLARSFLTLNKEDEIRALRWYPSDVFFSSGTLKNLSFEIGCIDEDRDAIKHNIDPLFFKNGWSCFGYQDKTMFRFSSNIDLKNIPFSVVAKGGQFYISEDLQYEESSIFWWTNGFKKLVELGEEIHNKKGSVCHSCESSINEEDSYFYDGRNYCESCYNDRYLYCENCDNDFPRRNMINTNHGNYCGDCYNELFVSCGRCGTAISIDVIDENEITHICDFCRTVRIN